MSLFLSKNVDKGQNHVKRLVLVMLVHVLATSGTVKYTDSLSIEIRLKVTSWMESVAIMPLEPVVPSTKGKVPPGCLSAEPVT